MEEGVEPIRVLIADDHPVVRRGMRSLLASLDGVVVVGEAPDGAAAVKEAQLTRPDVVVMDLQMPVLDGVEATRRLAGAVPDTAVLVLTMFEDDEAVFAAMRAGARGYLLKGAEQEQILAAIRSVMAGQVVIGPGVAARLLGHLAESARPSTAFGELTPRERQILDRVAQGRSNGAIAAELHLAAKTVGNHVSAIFAKLRVATRAEAVAAAREGGLGRSPVDGDAAGRGFGGG
jgi:DNA-binding NarL/FixJ family response regulator